MRQFPFVQKSAEEQKYGLFHITDYNYSREGTDKSSLGTKRLISIKRWSPFHVLELITGLCPLIHPEALLSQA